MSQVCHMSADQFAISVEKIEYLSAIETYNVKDACQKLGLWRGRHPIHNHSSFEDYLQEMESIHHTGIYRRQWHGSCDPKEL